MGDDDELITVLREKGRRFLNKKLHKERAALHVGRSVRWRFSGPEGNGVVVSVHESLSVYGEDQVRLGVLFDDGTSLRIDLDVLEHIFIFGPEVEWLTSEDGTVPPV